MALYFNAAHSKGTVNLGPYKFKNGYLRTTSANDAVVGLMLVTYYGCRKLTAEEEAEKDAEWQAAREARESAAAKQESSQLSDEEQAKIHAELEAKAAADAAAKAASENK